MKNNLHRFLAICLDIAEYYDTMGEKADSVLEDNMLKELGLGYRAFTGYLRQGVKEIIDLQNDFHGEKRVTKANKDYFKNLKQNGCCVCDFYNEETGKCESPSLDPCEYEKGVKSC